VLKEDSVGWRGYPPEFRRRVLDLIEAGRKVAEVADDLGISDQTIDTWRRQDRIDRDLEAGCLRRRRPSSSRRVSGSGSSRRSWRCTAGRSSCSRRTPAQRRFVATEVAAIEVMDAEGLPAQLALTLGHGLADGRGSRVVGDGVEVAPLRS